MNRGFSVIEMMIAIAVAVTILSGVIVFVGGDQTMAADGIVSAEALHKAQDLIEEAGAIARASYASVASSSVTDCADGPCYTKTITIPAAYATQCRKAVVGTVSWTGEHNRILRVAATTTVVNVPEMLALGGACAITPPPLTGWTNPLRFASDTYSPGKPTSIALLNKIAYLGADKAPFFYIVDTKLATLGQTSGLFSIFTNGFTAGNEINALAAAHDATLNKDFVFAAMNTATDQFRVIDVTNIAAPLGAATSSLSPCVAGANPEGWQVYYYDEKAYFIVRRVGGPEFHIFDVSNPTAPSEYAIGGALCRGYELNSTVESLVVKDQIVSGVTRRYAYMATDLDTKELRVFEVTDPLNPVEIAAANQDLPGAQDGASVFIVGNRLYLGRLSAGGADLYVYDISNPPAGLPLLGSKDIGTGVIGITVAGKFAFLATPKTNQEFQVWDIANPSNIANIAVFNFGNVVNNGVVYEYDRVYTTGQSTPNFQILYSP